MVKIWKSSSKRKQPGAALPRQLRSPVSAMPRPNGEPVLWVFMPQTHRFGPTLSMSESSCVIVAYRFLQKKHRLSHGKACPIKHFWPSNGEWSMASHSGTGFCSSGKVARRKCWIPRNPCGQTSAKTSGVSSPGGTLRLPINKSIKFVPAVGLHRTPLSGRRLSSR